MKIYIADKHSDNANDANNPKLVDAAYKAFISGNTYTNAELRFNASDFAGAMIEFKHIDSPLEATFKADTALEVDEMSRQLFAQIKNSHVLFECSEKKEVNASTLHASEGLFNVYKILCEKNKQKGTIAYRDDGRTVEFLIMDRFKPIRSFAFDITTISNDIENCIASAYQQIKKFIDDQAKKKSSPSFGM